VEARPKCNTNRSQGVLGSLRWYMEILDPMCAFLSNFEVLQLLREQKKKRELLLISNTASLGKENVQTIEFEASFLYTPIDSSPANIRRKTLFGMIAEI
jgi:hypothetical protein